MSSPILGEIGSYSDIGPRRDEQQDAFLSMPEHGVFGVFDGHGELGRTASRLASRRMEEWFSTGADRSKNDLRSVFKSIDASIPVGGGTTATVVRVTPHADGGRLITTNYVGDSIAYLIDPYKSLEEHGVIDLAPVHTPDGNPAERNRMVQAGYEIMRRGIFSPNQFYDPVENRSIGVSRSLGDRDWHDVLATPTVREKISRRERLLLIASDGVVNEDTYDDVVDDVQYMFRGRVAMGEIARRLVLDYAPKTKDNATAIVVHLPASE